MPYAKRSGADPTGEPFKPPEPGELEVGDGESEIDWWGFSGIRTLYTSNNY